MARARDLADRLQDPYQRFYYTGILRERQARAQLSLGHPGSEHGARELLLKAMSWYEKAEELREPDDDDPVLRWNSCLRTIRDHQLELSAPEHYKPHIE